MKFSNWLSWQVILLTVTAAGLGAAFAALGVMFMLIDDTNDLAVDLNRQTARVQLLESFVMQQTTHDVAALDAQAAAGETGPVAATPGASQTTHVPVAKIAAPQAKAVSRVPAPAAAATVRSPDVTSVSTQPRAAASAPNAVLAGREPRVAPPAPPASTIAGAAVSTVPTTSPPPIVTGEELIEATRTVRVEGVTAEKAGVKSLERNVVLMRNGTSVRRGERFPSGEKLLMVDVENGRLVTDQRQLLLFFQRPTSGQVSSTSTSSGAP
jgi:hypothetical protein